ncbi:MAG: hypothetical protein ACYS76_13770, partial [Planctomycetota bacterium]
MGNEELRSAGFGSVRAVGGPPETVVLGAKDPCNEDPEVGFRFQFELSSRGAAIRKATFSNGNDKGFDDRDPKNPQPLVLLSPVDGDIASMAIKEFVLVGQKRQLRLDRLCWRSKGVERGFDGSQTARFEATIEDTSAGEPMMKLTQTYKVHLGSYQLDCDIAVENLSANEQEVRFNLAGPVGIGREDTRSDVRKVIGGFRTAEGEVISSRKDLVVGFPVSLFTKKVGLKDSTDKYQEAHKRRDKVQIKEAREDLQIGRNLPSGQRYAQFLWGAITNKYFAAILRPVPDKDNDSSDWVEEKTSWFFNPDDDNRAGSGDETVGIKLRIAPEVRGPAGRANSTRTYSFQLFLGPKDKKIFDENEQYKNLGFVHTIDFMACCCPAAMIRPIAFGILAAMKWMYGFIHNYG